MRITKYTTKINQTTLRNELVKEKCVNYKKFQKLNSPSAIVTALNDLLDLQNMAEEYLYMLALNNKCAVTGIFEISHGTVNSSIASPREIFNKALLIGAVNIILVHNHPSGDVEPSRQDILLTKRVQDAGSLLGVELLDHIIVGFQRYNSLRESDLI